MSKKEYSCADCSAVWRTKGTTHCWSGDPEKGPPQPATCPCGSEGEVISEAFDLYLEEGSEDARMARVAAEVEGLCYEPVPGSKTVNARWTRVEDTLAFARLMGYERIGIATCVGLLDETQRLAMILKGQGFTPISVCCKSGSIDKLKLGIDEKYKVRPGSFEPACNPVAQARILNGAGTHMNIIVGLCVGHDILFAKYADAPTTTLVVKDRVTGHNPVATLYGQNFYYKRLQSQEMKLKR